METSVCNHPYHGDHRDIDKRDAVLSRSKSEDLKPPAEATPRTPLLGPLAISSTLPADPLDPKQKRDRLVLGARSSFIKGKNGSEGTTSMDSSFSDIDGM